MKKLIIVGLLVVFLFLIACSNSEKSCQTDFDCVPLTCCHASDAVNKENGPDCYGNLCTMECVEGTIDCGQGEIKCVSNECTAVFNE